MSTFEERVDIVHQWQRHYHMEPRSDSKLTTMFANGQLAMSADQVARELLATDFIYRHTLYGELIEEFFRHVANELKHHHDISWKATWEIVRFYGPIALKLICLMNTNNMIPQCMPPDDGSLPW